MRKKTYSSIQEIRLDRERLRFESMYYNEKLKSSSKRLFSGLSGSLRDLRFNIRNKLFTFSVFRSLSKTGMLYDFINNFARGFRQTRR